MRRPESPSCLISRGSIAAPRNSVSAILVCPGPVSDGNPAEFLNVLAHGLLYCMSSYFPMRSVPNGLAISKYNYLRRFVPDPCALADFLGKIAGALYVNQSYFTGKVFHLDRKSTRLNSSHVKI